MNNEQSEQDSTPAPVQPIVRRSLDQITAARQGLPRPHQLVLQMNDLAAELYEIFQSTKWYCRCHILQEHDIQVCPACHVTIPTFESELNLIVFYRRGLELVKRETG